MAKRRRLTAPDAAELEELEAGFAAKPSASPFETSTTPPIAHVAAEAAQLSSMAQVTDRAALVQDQNDAAQWRTANEAGLVAQKVGIDLIDADFIRRDRMVEDPEAMQELVDSLVEHGLRAPIEITKTNDGYGLISGYRRLQAFRRLSQSDDRFLEIPAFVRNADAGQGAYVSMVEENELRANLSHYERGRIAVLAAGQGVFTSVEEAVDVLFAAASKAKRSKVRSFALVHEALGDLLAFPVALTEKAGLQLAAALRGGAQHALREALSTVGPTTAQAEWYVLERTMADAETTPVPAGKGGRPKQVVKLDPIRLDDGSMIFAETAQGEARIKIKGHQLDADVLREIMEGIARRLS